MISRASMNTDQQPSGVSPQCQSQICGISGVSVEFNQNVGIPSMTPKLSFFSGDDPLAKHKCNFEQWLFKSKTLQ